MKFEELYKEHSKMVYNLALQYVQNTEDAEEISQDVFVSAYQHLHKFNGASSYKTWIYRITINKCTDHLKSKKRIKRFAFLQSIFKNNSLEILHEDKEFNHPGILLEQKESLQKIYEAINTLPEQQRTALILHKIEGLSQTEIAEILKISRKATESLVQRAKQNLKNNLSAKENNQ